MRQALARRLQPRRAETPLTTGREAFLPAPSGGWDTETPLAELPQTHARIFDNWMPGGVQIRLRKGYSDHVTGGTEPVATLMAYNAGASSALFAAAGDSIYNVTTAGSLGSAVVGSLTSARFSYTNFTTSGGSFLWICNGADDPRHWDGSAWATPSLTITTYTDNNISYVLAFKERLFFIFKNTLVMGYLGIQEIAGTISNYPLGAVFNRGGRLVALGAISRDGGDGVDDFFVALTSEGEVAVFQGSNPADADAWALVGVYYVGEPVGDRPFIDIGDDLAVITRNGVMSVSLIMSRGSEQATTAPQLTARVARVFRQYAQDGASYDGWEGLFVPAEDLMLVNAPRDTGVDDVADSAHQFIRYRVTGGWGRFTGWDFSTYALLGGTLYAGGYDGVVYKCFDGYDDDGAAVVGAVWTSWTSLGIPSLKTLMEVRALLTVATQASMRIVARTDFKASPLLGAWPAEVVSNALIWDQTQWDVAIWGGENASTRNWRAISGEGTNVSLVMEARSSVTEFSMNGWNLRFQMGGQV